MPKDTVKEGRSYKKDLLKIIHYGFFALHNHDLFRRLKMKISNETKAILKNFATINSGIKVDSGNQLKRYLI